MDNKYDESQDSRLCFWKIVNIYRHDGRLYIKRLIIFRCYLFSIMLHRIYLSDTDCLHDHPWGFLSIILKRGYWEFTPLEGYNYETYRFENSRWYSAGSILYRPAKWIHRLEMDEQQERSGKPTITLVITGRKIREWGFWTKLGWLYWMKYRPTGRCD